MFKFKKFNVELLENQYCSTLLEIAKILDIENAVNLDKDLLISEIIKKQESGILNGCEHIMYTPVISTQELDCFYEEIIEPPAGYIPPKPKQTDQIKLNYPQNFLIFSDIEKTVVVKGTVEILPAGYGFVRVKDYEISKEDVYLSKEFVGKYGIRYGDDIRVSAKFYNENESPAAYQLLELRGCIYTYFEGRKIFEELTPCFPSNKISIAKKDDIDLRFIDLVAPIGFGQRGLIVAPPKTGKTTILKKLTKQIYDRNMGAIVFALLIDERPEDVTDFKENIDAVVVSSTFDQTPEHHIRAAEIVLNKAKRYAELGGDAVILVDSLTGLTKAYNTQIVRSNKIKTGGLDPLALQKVKKYFGTARNFREFGSLTIIATALINTGNKIDEIIYEEFKGTGNMELYLSSRLSEKRIYPAIDIEKSGTRKEEFFLDKHKLELIVKLRKNLCARINATEALIELLKETKNNTELLARFDK